MLAGTQVGAYRVIERLGAGGMGEVWIAEHTKLGRRAAIKVLHAAMSRQPEIVARFFNEARAATAIADPGIVQVFDFGEHDGSSFIVMELLDGEALDKRLQRAGSLAIADALRITRQVASSLEAAHARGIIHRDLKPENIFLVRDPEVIGGERAKILDFGIAKLGAVEGGLKTQTSALMGTPTFMSPEQCRGAGLVDRRSDIYALGCVLYNLIVGRPPFESNGAGELIAMHLREPPPVTSSRAAGVPPEVDAIVARCLEKDPAQRFQSGRELAAAIGAILTGAPKTVPIPVEPEPRPPVSLAAASRPYGTTLAEAASEKQRGSRAGRGRPAALVLGAVAVAAAFAGVRLFKGANPGPGATPPAALTTATPAATALPPAAVAPAPPAPAPAVADPPPAPERARPTPPAAIAPSRAASRHAAAKGVATAVKKPARPHRPSGGDDDIPDSR